MEERKQPAETGETMTIQILRGNDMANIIINPYEPDEIGFTIDSKSFAILTERLSALAYRDGHDLLSFRTFENTIPFEEGEDETV